MPIRKYQSAQYQYVKNGKKGTMNFPNGTMFLPNGRIVVPKSVPGISAGTYNREYLYPGHLQLGKPVASSSPVRNAVPQKPVVTGGGNTTMLPGVVVTAKAPVNHIMTGEERQERYAAAHKNKAPVNHIMTGEERQERYAAAHRRKPVVNHKPTAQQRSAAPSFQTAFKNAQKKALGIFRWNGKLYNTMSKQDASNADYQQDFRDQHQDYNNFIQGNMMDRSKAGWGSGFKAAQPVFQTPGDGQPGTPIGSVSMIPEVGSVLNNNTPPVLPPSGGDMTFNRRDIRHIFNGIGATDVKSLVNGIVGMKDNGNDLKAQIYRKAGITPAMDQQQQQKMLYNTFTNNNINGSLGGNDRRRFREWLNPAQKFQQGGQMAQQPQDQGDQSGQSQGGDVVQQAQQIMQQVSQMSDQDRQQFDQAFAQFCKQNNIDINQLQGDKNAFAQAIVAFVASLQQQQVQSARMGAKLQYLESLKGECPEGQHLEYMKAGGKVCKRCMMDNPVPPQFAKKKKAKVSVVQSDMKEKGSKKALPMAKCGGKNKIGKKMNGGTLTQQFMNTYIK